MKRLLLTGSGYTSEQFARLAEIGYDVIHRETLRDDELHTIVPTLDAYILGGDERLDEGLLQKAMFLRTISFVGTGYGAFIDAAAADARGIVILNTPDVMADAVAEHTIGMLVGLVRGLFAQNDIVKRHHAVLAATRELREIVVGIIGMGAIGSRVARILVTAFHSQVVYYSRHRKLALEQELGLVFRTLEQLLEEVDALVLLLPTSPETIGLLDGARLAKLKRGTFLVNTAGASIVSPEALREALVARQVEAAAFDGYWIEPVPDVVTDPFGLLSLPDDVFVITPHTAARTQSSWPRMVERAIDNVVRHGVGR